MLIFFFFSSVMYFCGLLVFNLKRKHLLLMLLSLEFIILSIYFNMYLLMLIYNYELYFLMIFLMISVCESVLGLSILVSLIRTHGCDYMKMYSVLW